MALSCETLAVSYWLLTSSLCPSVTDVTDNVTDSVTNSDTDTWQKEKLVLIKKTTNITRLNYRLFKRNRLPHPSRPRERQTIQCQSRRREIPCPLPSLHQESLIDPYDSTIYRVLSALGYRPSAKKKLQQLHEQLAMNRLRFLQGKRNPRPLAPLQRRRQNHQLAQNLAPRHPRKLHPREWPWAMNHELSAISPQPS